MMTPDEIKEIEDYMERKLAAMKASDPQFDLKVEFGKLLTKPIESFTQKELKRYNEIKKILNP